MKSYRVLLHVFLTLSWTSLSGCYYQHDLQNQTMGSGGIGVGVGTLVGEAGGSVVAMGAGTIAGSMLGSVIGQHYDNQNAFMRQDVMTPPARLFSYQVLRPDLTIDCFNPGRIYISHNSVLKSANHFPPQLGANHD